VTYANRRYLGTDYDKKEVSVMDSVIKNSWVWFAVAGAAISASVYLGLSAGDYSVEYRIGMALIPVGIFASLGSWIRAISKNNRY
jgi:hypothetical protein